MPSVEADGPPVGRSRFPIRNVRVRTTRDCFSLPPVGGAVAAAAAALPAPPAGVLGSISSLATT